MMSLELDFETKLSLYKKDYIGTSHRYEEFVFGEEPSQVDLRTEQSYYRKMG